MNMLKLRFTRYVIMIIYLLQSLHAPARHPDAAPNILVAQPVSPVMLQENGLTQHPDYIKGYQALIQHAGWLSVKQRVCSVWRGADQGQLLELPEGLLSFPRPPCLPNKHGLAQGLAV